MMEVCWIKSDELRLVMQMSTHYSSFWSVLGKLLLVLLFHSKQNLCVDGCSYSSTVETDRASLRHKLATSVDVELHNKMATSLDRVVGLTDFNTDEVILQTVLGGQNISR